MPEGTKLKKKPFELLRKTHLSIALLFLILISLFPSQTSEIAKAAGVQTKKVHYPPGYGLPISEPIHSVSDIKDYGKLIKHSDNNYTLYNSIVAINVVFDDKNGLVFCRVLNNTVGIPWKYSPVSRWTMWYVEYLDNTNWKETRPVACKLSNATQQEAGAFLTEDMDLSDGSTFRIIYKVLTNGRLKWDLNFTAGQATSYRITLRIDDVPKQPTKVTGQKKISLEYSGFFSLSFSYDEMDEREFPELGEAQREPKKKAVSPAYSSSNKRFSFSIDLGALDQGQRIVIDPSLVGTSSADNAVGLLNQKKTFYAYGLHWVFYWEGTTVVYQTSTDGLNWAAKIAVTSYAGNGQMFSMFFNGTHLAYASAKSGTGEFKFRQGVPQSSGSISWNAVEQNIQTAAPQTYYYPDLVIDSSGYAWVGYRYKYTTTGEPYIIKNSKLDGTWTTAGGFPTSLRGAHGYSDEWRVTVVPLLSNKIYVVFTIGTASYGKLYNGGWGSEDTISTQSYNEYAGVNQGDVVHAAYRKQAAYSYAICYKNYTYGTGWGTEETILASSVESATPTLTLDTTRNYVYCFWKNTPITNHIYYKIRTGYNAWSSAVDYAYVDKTLQGHTSSYKDYNGHINLLFCYGISSPYYVFFSSITTNPFITGFAAPSKVNPNEYFYLNVTVREVTSASNLINATVAISNDVILKWVYATDIFSEQQDLHGYCTLDATSSFKTVLNSTSYKLSWKLKLSQDFPQCLVDIVSSDTKVYASIGYNSEGRSSLFLFGPEVSDPDWLSGFEYRKSHVIQGSTAGSQTNYVVPITVYYGSGNDAGVQAFLGEYTTESSYLSSKIFSFTKVASATEMFYLDVDQIQGVRISCGGIYLLHDGQYTKVDPYHAKPASPSLKGCGYAVPYDKGLVFYLGNNTCNFLSQMDKTGFVLFRRVSGTVKVPLLDGYSYATTGTVSGGIVTLDSSQEYVLYYLVSPPSLGTWYTASIESGTGFKINIKKAGVTEYMPYYMNYGPSGDEAYCNTTLTDNRISGCISKMKYPNNQVLIPTFLPFDIVWGNRGAYYQAYLLSNSHYYLTTYLDDPQTTTNDNGDQVTTEIYKVVDGDWFGCSWKLDYCDSLHTLRQIYSIVNLFSRSGSIWKVRAFYEVEFKSTCYNYDQGGTTTSFGITSWYEGTPNTNYKAYDTSWKDLTFSGSGYTWQTGYKGTRTNRTIGSDVVHVYTKYLSRYTSSGSVTPSTYKHSRYYVHSYTNHYYSEWGDITIPINIVLGLSCEMWYAETEQYEATPPSSTLESNNDWIGNYFKDPPDNHLSRSDFGDIRFTSSDKKTQLNYYYTMASDGKSATFYVKVPSISAYPSNTTIYVYYGNATATTTSSSTNMFPFIEHFEGSSLNLTRWTVGAEITSYYVSGSKLVVTGVADSTWDAKKGFYATFSYSGTSTFDLEATISWAQTAVTHMWRFGVQLDSGGANWRDSIHIVHNDGWGSTYGEPYVHFESGDQPGGQNALTQNGEATMQIIKKGSGTGQTIALWNGVTIHTGTNDDNIQKVYVFVNKYSTSTYATWSAIDYIFIRAIVDPEPIQTSWNTELPPNSVRLSLRLYTRDSSGAECALLTGLNVTVTIYNGTLYSKSYSSGWCNFTGITPQTVSGAVYWNELFVGDYSLDLQSDTVLDIDTWVYAINATFEGVEGNKELLLAVDNSTVVQLNWKQVDYLLSFTATSNESGNQLCKVNISNTYAVVGVPKYIQLGENKYVSDSVYWVGYENDLFSFYVPSSLLSTYVATSWKSGSSNPPSGSTIVPGWAVYILTISVEGDGTTSPAPGSYEVERGSIQHVVAISTLNLSVFQKWTLDGTSYNTTAIDVAMGANHTLIAYFGTPPLPIIDDLRNLLNDTFHDIYNLINGGTYVFADNAVNLYNVAAEGTGRSPLVYPESLVPSHNLAGVPIFDGILISVDATVYQNQYVVRYKFVVKGDSLPHKEAIGRLRIDEVRKIIAVETVDSGVAMYPKYNFTMNKPDIFASTYTREPQPNVTYIYLSLFDCEMNFERTFYVLTETTMAVNPYDGVLSLGPLALAFGWWFALFLAACVFVLAYFRGYGIPESLIFAIIEFLSMVLLLNMLPVMIGAKGMLDIPLGIIGMCGILVVVASGAGVEEATGGAIPS